MQAQPTTLLALGWPELSRLARALAARVAREPSDRDDLVQEGLFAAHKAIEAGVAAEHPYRLARTVLSRAMWNYYRRPRHEVVSIEAALRTPAPPPDYDFSLPDYYEALERCCGAEARRVAEQLIAYGESGIGARRCLGWSKRRWLNTLGEVRAFTRRWMAGARRVPLVT